MMTLQTIRDALEKCANMGEQIDCQLGSSDATVYAFRHERSLAHSISELARAALDMTDKLDSERKREHRWMKNAARWIKCHDIYGHMGRELLDEAKELLNDDGEFLFKKGEIDNGNL